MTVVNLQAILTCLSRKLKRYKLLVQLDHAIDPADLNSLQPPVLLQHPPHPRLIILLLLLLQAALMRLIRTNRMVRPSIPAPFAPCLVQYSALPTSTFNTIPMVILNDTSRFPPPMTSAVTAFLPPPPTHPPRATHLAHLDCAPAVVTTATTVPGVFKRTRFPGCSFHNPWRPQGCPRTDCCRFVSLLPRMTTNILSLV